MADISAEIAAFQSAAYGEDVRTALVNLANKINNESSAAATTVATTVAGLTSTINDIDETISIRNRPVIVELGYALNKDGSIDSSSNQRGHTDYVSTDGISYFTVTAKAYNNICCACAYDADKVFLRPYCIDSVGSGEVYDSYIIKPLADEKYFRFSTVQQTVNPIIAYPYSYNNDLNKVPKMCNDVDIITTSLKTSILAEVVTGSSIGTDGADYGNNNKYQRTEYISTAGIKNIKYSGKTAWSVPGICSYDENMVFIRYYFGTSDAGEYSEQSFTPQIDESYLRFGTVDKTTNPLIVTYDIITDDVVERIETLESNVGTGNVYGSPLKGKKWVVCGDSFSHGDFSSSEANDYITDGKYKNYPAVYSYLIGNRTLANIVMLATNGQTMAVTSGNNSFIDRYQNIPSDADYITLWYGINDRIQKVPIGTISDTSTSTFYGAWNTVMTYIRNNFPFAHIGIVITNGGGNPDTTAAQELLDYCEAERKIAKKYGVPYLDLQKDTNLPLILFCTDRADIDYSVQVRINNEFKVSQSNWHPSSKAHEFQSYFIEKWLLGL